MQNSNLKFGIMSISYV